jgi:hypothetical protein
MRKFTPIHVFLLLAVSTACGSSTAKNDASKSEKQASNTAEKQVNANIPKELRGIKAIVSKNKTGRSPIAAW